MYRIVCDGKVLHDANVNELKVIQAVCNLEVNKTGSLTFKLPPTHPYYNDVKKHQSEITLYQDDDILFVGRVLNDETDFYNVKNVECEGVLSYFLDSIQRGKVYQLNGGSTNVIETYLKDLVSIHNSQVDTKKQFTVGVVNITDPNNYLYKASNFTSTLSVMTDDLLKTYGGYFQVRFVGGKKYLDYVSDYTNVCNQRIEFGKNIVDLTKYLKGEEIFTALIPLGATNPDTAGQEQLFDDRLNISSVANQTIGTIVKRDDYIYDSVAVQRWGWIWSVQKWDDVTVASNLFTNALDALRMSVNDKLVLEMTAIDLHLLNVQYDKIRLGDNIQCVSLPHNINAVMMVQSIGIDIDNPANTSIKLCLPTEVINDTQSITSNTNNNISSLNGHVDNINQQLLTSYPTYNDLNREMDNVKDWVRDACWTKDQNGQVDMSGYATVTEVNRAFAELAGDLEGV